MISREAPLPRTPTISAAFAVPSSVALRSGMPHLDLVPEQLEFIDDVLANLVRDGVGFAAVLDRLGGDPRVVTARGDIDPYLRGLSHGGGLPTRVVAPRRRWALVAGVPSAQVPESVLAAVDDAVRAVAPAMDSAVRAAEDWAHHTYVRPRRGRR